MWTQDSPIVKECFKTGQKKQTALRSHVPYLSSSSLSNAPYKFNPLFKPLHLHKKDSSGEIQTGECQFSIPIKAQHLSHLWCGVVTHKLNWNGIHNSGGVVCEDVLYTRFLLCFSVRAYHRLCRGRCCGRPPPPILPLLARPPSRPHRTKPDRVMRINYVMPLRRGYRLSSHEMSNLQMVYQKQKSTEYCAITAFPVSLMTFVLPAGFMMDSILQRLNTGKYREKQFVRWQPELAFDLRNFYVVHFGIETFSAWCETRPKNFGFLISNSHEVFLLQAVWRCGNSGSSDHRTYVFSAGINS